LKPGERLIELKLAKSSQVGQPTLREARAAFWQAQNQVE
jgi:DNA-binding GntR family transcriptional regulator